MILKNTKLRNSLKKITKSQPEVEDILIFGSTVRGKIQPKDTDIMVIFKKKIDKKTEYKIRKELEKHYDKLSLISKTKKNSLEPTFDARESILFEGTSLLTGKNLAQAYGFSPLGIFKYNFKKWNNLQKTKFYYALNGRSGKAGILELLNCTKLTDNVILAPLNKIEQMKDFLDSWDLNYIYIPSLIPNRFNKRRILQ